MTREQYALLENCMRKCMRGCDGAHDAEHVYRVLGVGLDIVAHEPGADADVVVAACLLHDIGRREQLQNRKICHAKAGRGQGRRIFEKERL